MRRAAVLLLAVVLPLAIVLFPRFRRALARHARLLLLVLSGAILAAGISRLLLPGPALALSGADRLLALAGLAILLASFLLVARDVRRAGR